MAGINIPGVTDQYNTNETVEKLMKVERIPLTREQKQLETYKAEQDAWRDINIKLSSLRDSTKTLYSYDNPFNNKLVDSTQADAITAEATRSAPIQSFKVDVIQPASADRLLTDELSMDYRVAPGVYTFKVGEKQLTVNWKGGSLKDFSTAINKRGNGIINSMIIGASQGKRTLLIESLATGKENKLIFEGAAKAFAMETGMISPVTTSTLTFGKTTSEVSAVQKIASNEPKRMPELSITRTSISTEGVTVQPRGAYQVGIPAEVKSNTNNHISFTVKPSQLTDITIALNQRPEEPVIQAAGFGEFEGIVVHNFDSDTTLTKNTEPIEPVDPVHNKNIIYAVLNDGTEKPISTPAILIDEETKIDIPVSEYPDLKSIAVRNYNTGYSFEVSSFSAYDAASQAGYTPNHAVSIADDAIIKYEGIKITRPSNKIDDVIPEITLNLHEKTEKTATISVKPDTDAAKDALLQFVGKYNQTVAKLNILTQNKSEIVEELDYYTDDEKEKAREQLGMFLTEQSLSSIKTNMSSIISGSYNFIDDAEITMLSQLGIATNAAGFGGGYQSSKLRGYLEIDEKKLDAALQEHLDDIKAIFGYDTDGDMIIDSGIAYKLDKQIGAYTQIGGILALKTSSLDSKIKNSESKIARLEDQLNEKEANYRNQFSSMQGTLNSLESQQNSISNFTKQQQNNR